MSEARPSSEYNPILHFNHLQETVERREQDTRYPVGDLERRFSLFKQHVTDDLALRAPCTAIALRRLVLSSDVDAQCFELIVAGVMADL